MTWILRQGTAGQTVEFGPFVTTSDAVTVMTSAIASNDIKLFKNQATGQTAKNSGGASYVTNGWYYATFDATDTDTVGRLKVTVNMTSVMTGTTGALPVWFDAQVISSTVYDALYNSTGAFTASQLTVNATQIAGSSTGAQNMSSASLSFVNGTVNSTGAVPSVTACKVFLGGSSSAFTSDGQIQGRQVVFKGDVTGGLTQQATQIASFTAATSTMTYTALSVAPAHGDSFAIF